VSDAELLLSVQLEQAGIPFEREYAFAKPRRFRADFIVYGRPIWDGKAWQPHRLLIEVEGGIGGTSRHATYTGFTNDCTKYNLAAELGFTVLRFTSRMVNEGDAFEQIRRILESKEDNRDAA
jgi:very-short-patch-repair endonuclease